MAGPTFDLQSHSTYSDGDLEPAEVVARAARAGVRLLALSDHDTVDGIDEALVAGRDHGVTVVPAVEISALRSADEDVHILGYGIGHHDPTLRARLEDFRADRELRAQRIAERLEEIGFALDRADIDARRAASLPVGRPHLAAAALDAAGNSERLRDEHIADAGTFIERYLVPGAPAYLPRHTPTVSEAIEAIHGAGGVAVWAHPFWDVEAGEEVLAELDRFTDYGLDGAECFYITHAREQTELLCERCTALGLLQTGSADFHGPRHPRFHSFRAFELYGREPALGSIA